MSANRVYQEYIADKQHLHMNATRWVTLTEFVKHLGRSAIARVDETEKGWFIAWIDNSPKALEKAVCSIYRSFIRALTIHFQEASLKKDRATMSDEQRERQLIAEQIERAKAEAGKSDTPPPAVEEGLKRDENVEKVVLSFSAKPVPSENPTAPTSLKINPLKASSSKRPNVFKLAAASSSASDRVDKAVNDKKRPTPMSAAERLILEEQERKRRRMERDNTDL